MSVIYKQEEYPNCINATILKNGTEQLVLMCEETIRQSLSFWDLIFATIIALLILAATSFGYINLITSLMSLGIVKVKRKRPESLASKMAEKELEKEPELLRIVTPVGAKVSKISTTGTSLETRSSQPGSGSQGSGPILQFLTSQEEGMDPLAGPKSGLEANTRSEVCSLNLADLGYESSIVEIPSENDSTINAKIDVEPESEPGYAVHSEATSEHRQAISRFKSEPFLVASTVKSKTDLRQDSVTSLNLREGFRPTQITVEITPPPPPPSKQQEETSVDKNLEDFWDLRRKSLETIRTVMSNDQTEVVPKTRASSPDSDLSSSSSLSSGSSSRGSVTSKDSSASLKYKSKRPSHEER